MASSIWTRSRRLVSSDRRIRPRGEAMRGPLTVQIQAALDRNKTSLDDSGGGGEPADERAAGRSHVERMIDLHAAIDQLPDDLRGVVRLHFFQGLTYDTIAAVIDVHPDTVKRVVLRAKVELARELDGFDRSDD